MSEKLLVPDSTRQSRERGRALTRAVENLNMSLGKIGLTRFPSFDIRPNLVVVRPKVPVGVNIRKDGWIEGDLHTKEPFSFSKFNLSNRYCGEFYGKLVVEAVSNTLQFFPDLPDDEGYEENYIFIPAENTVEVFEHRTEVQYVETYK